MVPAMETRPLSAAAARDRRPAVSTLMALMAGLMFASAMPPLQGTAPLVIPAVAMAMHALRTAERPGRAGFVFGMAYAVPLMFWLFSLDPAKSIPTRALVPVQALGAMAFVAAHYALLGWVVGRVRRLAGPRRLLAFLPLLWWLTEWLRTTGEMAFPWCLSGAAWIDTPLRPLYAAAGEMGLGAATAMTAAALVGVTDAVTTRRRGDLLAPGLVASTLLAWMFLAAASGPADQPPAMDPGVRTEPLTVAAVQADVAQADKWDDARIDSTRIPYTELTAEAAARGADLVVWAETAIPAYVRYERALMEWVRGTARDNAVPILAGFPDAELVPGTGRDGVPRQYLKSNSAGLFSAHGTLQARYAKHHLLPIGESMPFQRWLPFLGGIDVGQAEWTPGPPPGPMIVTTPGGDVAVFTVICFEAVFGDLARQAVRRGATVMVNITNDGWFGLGSGPRQHAALARIRAAECGVPLVRSANNGISMVCDAQGAVLGSLDLHRRGVVVAAIDPVPRPTWFVRLGARPALIGLLAWTVGALMTGRLPRAWRKEDA